MRRLFLPLMAVCFAFPALAAEGGSAFPPFDSRTFAGQLFWLAVFFGLLYWMMSRIALPRIGSILEERRAKIESDLRAAEAAQKQAEEAAIQHEQALAKARANAQAIASEAKAKSARQADEKRHKVEQELAQKMIAAERTIAETKASAMTSVGEIAREAAAAMVEQLSGKKPTAAALAKALGGRE